MTITTYEEGVEKLNNLTLRAINLLDKRLTKLEADKDSNNEAEIINEQIAKEVVKIVKILPKLLYILQQVRIMQKEIEAKKAAEKKKYSKADLIVAQNYVNKQLKELEDGSHNNTDSIAA
jgi:hypothetical protein